MDNLNQFYLFRTKKGLIDRGLSDKPEYQERLDYENKVITEIGFSGYFLIVQDVLTWCRNNNIFVGPGRGSCVGSLACYCLKITNLDPLKYNLLFERFLNYERLKSGGLCDIDIDIEKRYRHKVIDYISDKYGNDKVSHIVTFNMLRAKAAVRAVQRTLGLPYEIGDQLAKLLLNPIHGKPQKLTESIKQVAELQAYYNNEKTDQHKILKLAKEIEDTASSVGIHASGIVIGNKPIQETVPLCKGKEGEVITQWAMEDVERVGLIKFDFLGLDALTKIHICTDLIKQINNIDLNIDLIPIDDEETYKLLQQGETVGVFQVEGSGITDLTMQVKPTCLEDISAIAAIYRPGPLAAPYKDIYLAIRAGKQKPKYLIPELEPILKDTSSWCIYQEQMMSIAKELCGYTGGEAEELRKACGKKKMDLMKEHEKKFKEGWIKNGHPSDLVHGLWEELQAFASYSFNKSHSCAYSYIAYQMAFLKAHYPNEFMCSLLIAESNNQDDIIKDLYECKRMNIKVLPPDINESDISFSLNKQKIIRFGIEAIKNVGTPLANSIIKERKKSLFKDLNDFCQRIDLLNRGQLEALVLAGAFDSIEENRATSLYKIETLWEYKKILKSYNSKLETYNKKLCAYEERLHDIEEGKLSKTGKKLSKLKLPVKPEYPELPEFPIQEELPVTELQKNEKNLLGVYVSSHPMNKIQYLLDHTNTPIKSYSRVRNKKQIKTIAVLTKIVEKTTKKKERMAILHIEDLTGNIEITCFPNIFNKIKDIIEESKIFIFKSTINNIEIDENKITRAILSDLINIKEQNIEDIEINIDLNKIDKLLRALDRYQGNLITVKASIKSKDGTIFHIPERKIGNYKDAFVTELKGLQ